MNENDKEKIKNVLFIAIAIIIAIIAVRFVLWLLPIILIAVVAYFLYNHMRNKKHENMKIIKDDKYKKKS